MGAPQAGLQAGPHHLFYAAYGQDYVDAGAEHYERRNQQRTLRAAKRLTVSRVNHICRIASNKTIPKGAFHVMTLLANQRGSQMGRVRGYWR